jgi:aubergine-like protein
MRLLDSLEKHPKTQPTLAEWKLGIKQEPMAIAGKLLDIGALEFGQNQLVFPEKTPNLDREMQKPVSRAGLYSLGNLVVFFADECHNEFMTFKNMIPNCLRSLDITFPSIIEVGISQFNNFANVKNSLTQNLNQSSTACVIIIPGRKKQGRHYDEIKRYLLQNIPVPSQIVLSLTMNGKNLQSIVFKIFVQICAKIGGIPWAIKDLPFASHGPTMVFAFNNYTRPGHANGVYTMMASMNPSCTVYLPKIAEGRNDHSMVNFVMQQTEAGLREFMVKNSLSGGVPTLPRFIIAYREGVSKGQQRKTILEEIEAMKAAMAVVYKDKSVQVRLMYVVCSKTSNVKLFWDPSNSRNPSGLQNPPPGTYVAEPVATEPTEFFLNSQRPSKGLLAPIGYNIILNEVTEIDRVPAQMVKEAVAKLTNKLCYLYYNTSNPIKLPAPVHLAIRLAYFYTEHSTPSQKMIIHGHLERLCSAYYI